MNLTQSKKKRTAIHEFTFVLRFREKYNFQNIHIWFKGGKKKKATKERKTKEK